MNIKAIALAATTLTLVRIPVKMNARSGNK